MSGYGEPLFILQNTNFNPNDGVNTTHIVGASFPVVPDYAVVTDEGGEILSRWYVMECMRTRGMQYRLNLLRDVMAEYRSQILTATCYIEKGFVQQSSPLIFNNEDMGFNQIKSGEYLLEDDLKTPWLVLYLSRYNGEGAYNTFKGNFKLENTSDEVDYVLDSLSDYKYNYWTTDGGTPEYIITTDEDMIFMMEYSGGGIYENTNNFYLNILKNRNPQIALDGITNTGRKSRSYRLTKFKYIGAYSGGFPSGNYGISSINFNTLYSKYQTATSIVGNLPFNSYTNTGTKEGFDLLRAENGKRIKVGEKIYQISVSNDVFPNPPGFPTPEDQWDLEFSDVPSASDLGLEMEKIFSNSLFQRTTSEVTNYKILYKRRQMAVVRYIEMGADNLFYDFSYTSSVTQDSPYEIIATPYRDTTFTNVPNIVGDFISFGDIGLQWFQNIINKYNGEGAAYDLQIVPYCPISSNDLSKENVVFCYTGEGQATNQAVAIKLRKSNFSKLKTISNLPIRSDKKLSNSVDIYRICSPNGVGEYEWSPAKNGGNIGSFEIDCTLIPFNPYIKINPVFYDLYGNDYDDFRGLICGGDFSMPILNNAWETYQLSNKYYQDIFNRDIQHQEYNNKLSRIQEGIGMGLSTINGAVQGAQSGGAAGAVMGGLTSLAGGVTDFAINESARRENIQYQKDRFGYELGTIKARSQSLTRSTSYNVNNKYFPYIEYYTCTATEIEAFRNKIKYNGMTVEVIGKIQDYMNPAEEWTYIQGEIIELDIPDDFQIVAEINRTLRGGIRIVYTISS